MGTLYLDRSGLELRIDGDALALYTRGERSGTVPIGLLEKIVIKGEISLTSNVLGRLADAGVSVLMLSARHSRRVAFVHGRFHNDARVRLAHYRAVLDDEYALGWSSRIVRAKISAQVAFLKKAGDEKPEAKKDLFGPIAGIKSCGEALSIAVTTDGVRGLEGASARLYFAGLSHLFPPSLQFNGRNRRPPRDPVNAVLSLAYTLAHHEAVRACHLAGLDPLLGFLHKPAWGRESLACDLIEPFRPRLDAWVWGLFRERVLRPEDFHRDKGAVLLGKAGRHRFYEAYEAKSPVWSRALVRLARALASSVTKKTPDLFLADEEDES